MFSCRSVIGQEQKDGNRRCELWFASRFIKAVYGSEFLKKVQIMLFIMNVPGLKNLGIRSDDFFNLNLI